MVMDLFVLPGEHSFAMLILQPVRISISFTVEPALPITSPTFSLGMSITICEARRHVSHSLPTRYGRHTTEHACDFAPALIEDQTGVLAPALHNEGHSDCLGVLGGLIARGIDLPR